jgi:copper(I)-binding protein
MKRARLPRTVDPDFPINPRRSGALYGDSQMRFSFLFALALGLFAANAAQAHSYNVGSLHIGHPWSRAVPKGAQVAGGYFTITNNGTTPDRLIGGSAEIAGRFQIHEMKTEDGVMKMRELDKGLEIAPGQTVKFGPNGYHVMLLDLKRAPKEGESFMGTLVFEKAGKVDVKFVVAPIGSMDGKMGGAMQHDMNHMDHMNQMNHMDHMQH